MGKKRKTRQQKIILQLKRKLAAQSAKGVPPETKIPVRQEAISYKAIAQPENRLSARKQDNLVFSYDPGLVRKDVLKTLILSLLITSLQFMLYLKLR